MGHTVVATMQALEVIDEPNEVVAHLVGVIYELAMRLGVSPRTIADGAFCSVASDSEWQQRIQPALLDLLGRYL